MAYCQNDVVMLKFAIFNAKSVYGANNYHSGKFTLYRKTFCGGVGYFLLI